MRKLLVGFVLGCLLLPLGVMGQANVVGDWKGMMDADAIQMRVALHVKAGASGEVAQDGAKLDLLDQGMNGLALTQFRFVDSVLTFSFSSATYEGRMQPDGKIAGEWRQPTMKLPLNFERGEWQVNRPQEPKGPFPYSIEEVKFTNAAVPDVTLAGTLTVPNACEDCPVVILISGSGPSNRDEEIMLHKPFGVLADYLSRNGVAVLRYDDRGVGASTGKFAMATSADFATDAVAAVSYLKGRTDLHFSKIGLLGHSEGGMIGPLAATQTADVDFLVLLAGPGVRCDLLMAEQTELVMRAMEASEEDVRTARKTNEALYSIIVKSKSIPDARKKIEKYVEKAAKADTSFAKEAVLASIPQFNNVWFRYFIKYDPAPVLAQVKCPVLAINGEKDIQVPAKLNLDAIAQTLQNSGNKDVTIKLLPGLNHLFQHCTACTVTEYGLLEETMAPEVLELVGKWILAHGR